MDPFATVLDADSLRQVLRFLPLRGVLAAGCTCSLLHAAADDDLTWHTLAVQQLQSDTNHNQRLQRRDGGGGGGGGGAEAAALHRLAALRRKAGLSTWKAAYRFLYHFGGDVEGLWRRADATPRGCVVRIKVGAGAVSHLLATCSARLQNSTCWM